MPRRSDPEEGVLPAVLEALGPLRAAAVSVSVEGGAARGADASPLLLLHLPVLPVLFFLPRLGKTPRVRR